MVVVWYEQHGGLTHVYVSCFMVIIRKSETNLPIKTLSQQLLSIRVECFQVAIVLSAEIRYGSLQMSVGI